jgi:hypothetical protein
LKLYRIMYYDSRDLYLERKKRIFDDFASNRINHTTGPVV